VKPDVTPVGVERNRTMGRRLGLAAVIATAVAVVAYKAVERRNGARVSALASGPAVVLVADVREADSGCGCGEIIRRVRAAKARGVSVAELAPDDGAVRRYGVTVAPTVVFLGKGGQVVSRREGEGSETIAAISADLDRLERGTW
jgi:hypothetical protein